MRYFPQNYKDVAKYIIPLLVVLFFSHITLASFVRLDCSKIVDNVCVVEKQTIVANPGDIILPSKEKHTSILLKSSSLETSRCDDLTDCRLLLDLRQHEIEFASTTIRSSILHVHAKTLQVDSTSVLSASHAAPTVVASSHAHGINGGGGGHSGFGGLGCCYGRHCQITNGETYDHAILPEFPGGHSYLNSDDVPAAYGGGIVNITVAKTARIDGEISANGASPTSIDDMIGGSAGGTIIIATGVGDFDDYDYDDDDDDPEPDPDPEPEPEPEPDPNPDPNPKPDPDPTPKQQRIAQPLSRLRSPRMLHILNNMLSVLQYRLHSEASYNHHPNVEESLQGDSDLLRSIQHSYNMDAVGMQGYGLPSNPLALLQDQCETTNTSGDVDAYWDCLFSKFPPRLLSDVQSNPILRGTPGSLSGEGVVSAIGGMSSNGGGGGGGGRIAVTKRASASSIRVVANGGAVGKPKVDFDLESATSSVSLMDPDRLSPPAYCEGGGGGTFVEVGSGTMALTCLAKTESAPIALAAAHYTTFPPHTLSGTHCKFKFTGLITVARDVTFTSCSTMNNGFSITTEAALTLSASTVLSLTSSTLTTGSLTVDQTSSIVFRQSLSIVTGFLVASSTISEESNPPSPTTLRISAVSKVTLAPLVIRAGSIYIEAAEVVGSNTGVTATTTLVESECEQPFVSPTCKDLISTAFTHSDALTVVKRDDAVPPMGDISYQRFFPSLQSKPSIAEALESLATPAVLSQLGFGDNLYSPANEPDMYLSLTYRPRLMNPIYPQRVPGSHSLIVWRYIPSSLTNTMPTLNGPPEFSKYALTVAAAKINLETQSYLKAHSVAICSRDFTLMGSINTALQGCGSDFGAGTGGASGLAGGGAGHHKPGGRSFFDQSSGAQSAGGDAYYVIPPVYLGSGGGNPRSGVGNAGSGGGIIYVFAASSFHGTAASLLSDAGPSGQRGGGGSGGSITVEVCDFTLSSDTIFSARGGDGHSGSGGGSGGVFYINYFDNEVGKSRKCKGNVNQVVPLFQLEGGKGGRVNSQQLVPPELLVAPYSDITPRITDDGDDDDDDDEEDYFVQGISGGRGGFYSKPECKPGSAGFSCAECQPGTASSTPDGELSCKPCDLGRYATTAGSVSCALCQPGRFADEKGSTTCKKCPGGKHAKFEGSSECTICVPGRYSHEGQAECSLCEINQRSSAESTQCVDCAPGTTSPRGSSTCFECDPISPNAYFTGPGCGFKCNAGYVFPKCQTPLQRCIEVVGGVLNLFIIVLLSFLLLTIPLMLVWYLQRRATEAREKHDVLAARKVYQEAGEQQQALEYHGHGHENDLSVATTHRRPSSSSFYDAHSSMQSYHTIDVAGNPTHAPQLAVNNSFRTPLLADLGSASDVHRTRATNNRHTHETISISNTAHLHLAIYDIPNLLARVYLHGSNTPGRNLSLAVDVPSHLRGIVLETPYRMFAVEVNKITQWTRAQRVIAYILRILFYPFYALYLQRVQFQIIQALANFIAQHPHDFISDSRSRALGDTLRLGFSTDLTTFWIDFIDNTHRDAQTGIGYDKLNPSVRVPVKGPSLPLVVCCSGTGEFNFPYYIDLTDALVKSVSCYFGHNWYSFLLTLNCFLRSIPYHGVHSPKFVDPVLNYLAMMNRVGGIGIGTEMQLSGMVVDIGVIYEPISSRGDVGQLESIRSQDSTPSTGKEWVSQQKMWPRLVLIIRAERRQALDHFPVPKLAPPNHDSTTLDHNLVQQFDQSLRVKGPSDTVGSFDAPSAYQGSAFHDQHMASSSIPAGPNTLDPLPTDTYLQSFESDGLAHLDDTMDGLSPRSYSFDDMKHSHSDLLGGLAHSPSQSFDLTIPDHDDDDDDDVIAQAPKHQIDINFDDFDNGDDDLQNSSLIEAALGYNPHKMHNLMSPKQKKRATHGNTLSSAHRPQPMSRLSGHATGTIPRHYKTGTAVASGLARESSHPSTDSSDVTRRQQAFPHEYHTSTTLVPAGAYNPGDDDDDDDELNLPYGARKLESILRHDSGDSNTSQQLSILSYSDSDEPKAKPKVVYLPFDRLSFLCLSNGLRNNYFTLTSLSFVLLLSVYFIVFVLFNITYAQLAPFRIFLSTLLVLPFFPILLPCVGFLCVVTRSVRMAQVFTVINVCTLISNIYKAIIVTYSYLNHDVDYVMLFMSPMLLVVNILLFPISHQYIAHLAHKRDIELCRRDYLRDKFQLELSTAQAMDEPLQIAASEDEQTTSLHRSLSTLSNASTLDVDITPRTPS